MSKNNLHIIHKLKQTPKQGNIWDDLVDGLENSGKATDGLTNSNNQLIGGLGKVSSEIRKLADNYSDAINKTKWLEDANKGLQETFGLSIEDATRLGAELDNMSKSLGVGGNKLRKYRQDLKGLIGGFAGVAGAAETSQKYLYQTQTLIQNNLKLSAEQANKFIRYSAGVGKQSDEMLVRYGAMAEALTKNYGIQVSARDLIADTANLTEDLQLQYGKIPQKLSLAVVKAKALGLTMADLNKTGQNLLNIESSIGQEIEYQLLSGRRLVDEVSGESLTNAYRQATLQGDGVKQAELMNQIIKQEGKTLKNNLFARQQMAQLLGTDEATVSRTLQQQELLSQIGGETLMEMSAEKMNEAVKALPEFQKLDDQAKAEYLAKLEKVQDTRTTEQRMADSLDTMVSEGIILRSGGASALAAAAGARATAAMVGQNAVTGSMSKTFMTSENVNLAGAALAGVNTMEGIFGTIDAFQEAIEDATITGPWSVNTTGNVTIGTAGMENAGDLFMGPGAGRAVIGPEGSFALSNNDAILASPTAGQGGDMSGFAAAIVNAIKQQTDALTSNSGINGPYWS
jgi:hypothetical protein